MSSKTPAQRKATFIKAVGIGSLVLGILFVVAGIATWTIVSSQLKEENITISNDGTAPFLGGEQVKGPFSAYAQTEVIKAHAAAGAEGTYAELGGMIRAERDAGNDERADELQAQRDNMMNASFLRASLFTSVLAYGVSAMVIGLGVLLAFIGVVIRQLSVGFQPREAAIAAPAKSDEKALDKE